MNTKRVVGMAAVGATGDSVHVVIVVTSWLSASAADTM